MMYYRPNPKAPTRYYSIMDELMASPTEPMPIEKRRFQLTRMWQGLAAIETADLPTKEDWRMCSDAVNLMETLVQMGQVEDKDGLIMAGVTALALAGQRSLQGNHIRLDGAGIQSIRAVLEDYAEVLAALPARTMVRCHRLTELRFREILAGKGRPHDVKVTVI